MTQSRIHRGDSFLSLASNYSDSPAFNLENTLLYCPTHLMWMQQRHTIPLRAVKGISSIKFVYLVGYIFDVAHGRHSQNRRNETSMI
jgi:hypothetical protein